MKPHLALWSVAAVLLCMWPGTIQAGPRRPATSQTEKADRKAREEEFWAKRNLFRKQAKAALDREMAREKAVCQEPMTTYDQNVCLRKEIETTNANYQDYLSALRSLLGLKGPWGPPPSGPTGKPLSEEETVKQFDEVETLWQKYHKSQASAVYDDYRGGTIAPIMAGICDLQLTRNHMRELDSIYDPMLWH